MQYPTAKQVAVVTLGVVAVVALFTDEWSVALMAVIVIAMLVG